MRRIAHISDLHFGTIPPKRVNALLADILEQEPSLVVISGDLTQRARRSQFLAARDFLERLPFPYLVLPGNHDIPLYNLFRRFTRPLDLYKQLISRDLTPFHIDEEMAIVGINTARQFHWKEGRVSREQLLHLQEILARAPGTAIKILFTHHPFLPPPDAPETRLVGKARRALAILERCGVDLLLAGHLHRAYIGDIVTHHTMIQRSILVAQASTATSTRLRREPNAYNLITIDAPRLSIQVRSWEGAAFMPGLMSRFVREAEQWRLVAQDPGLSPTGATA